MKTLIILLLSIFLYVSCIEEEPVITPDETSNVIDTTSLSTVNSDTTGNDTENVSGNDTLITGNDPTESSLIFISLSAEKTTIKDGETTKIFADATGEGELTFQWWATAGDILGGGKEVTYTGYAGCCGGKNTIECTISDKAGNSVSKSINITLEL